LAKLLHESFFELEIGRNTVCKGNLNAGGVQNSPEK